MQTGSSGIQLIHGTNSLWEGFSIFCEIYLYNKYISLYLLKIVKAPIVPLPSQLFCGGRACCGTEQPRRHNQGAESGPHCAKPTEESSWRLGDGYLHLKRSAMNLLHWGLNPSTSNPAGSLIQVNGITCLSKTRRI